MHSERQRTSRVVHAAANPTGAGFIGDVEITFDPDTVTIVGRRFDSTIALARVAVSALLLVACVVALASGAPVIGLILAFAAALLYAAGHLAMLASAAPASETFPLASVADAHVGQPSRPADLLEAVAIGGLTFLQDRVVIFRVSMASGRDTRYALRARPASDARRLEWLLRGSPTPPTEEPGWDPFGDGSQ